jgi:CMP/dCMP kinase
MTGSNAAPLVIAVDGPAASGKGTISRALSDEFHLPHMDTGMLYRAVGLAALHAGVALDDETALAAIARTIDPQRYAVPAIRSAAVAEAASRVSALAAVRAALLQVQRDFAGGPAGAVLDGRDIGTVIAPAATAKLFITARADVRAARRHAELAASGVTLAAVLADIAARDARDSGRAAAPLLRAADAILLDTSDLAIDAAVAQAIRHVRARVPR